MPQTIKTIHFIGICGVAMSALALALKRAGYEVTGSDVGIYPPISTYLKESGVDYYTGWHPEKMEKPDLVVVGNVASSNNPEWLYVQKNKLNYKSYPEVVAEFFMRENSIVCAGTYGKTTSSAILTWVLKDNGFDPSYMFGGISLNDMPAANIGGTILNKTERSEETLSTIVEERDPSVSPQDWSVIEGDEYKSARWDNGPKFAHYSPTHLLLTSVVWDHADVYPTEKSYVDAFANLLKNIPENGLVVLSAKVTHDRPELTKLAKSKVITYGKTPDNDYQYFDVKTNKNGISFKIKHQSSIFNLQSSNLGDYMADNITGCFAMAHQLDIEPERIIKSLSTFKNIKRRLEKRYSNGVTVFDDIAHSPKKAEAVLASIRNIYTRHPERILSEPKRNEVEVEGSLSSKIIAIFEPNGGNRLQESIPGYDNKFISADEVIIPRLTHIKQDPTKPKNLDGQDLTNVISKTHDNVKYIDNDEKLINYLVENTAKGDVIIFLGSHGFRGMIDELINKLS